MYIVLASYKRYSLDCINKLLQRQIQFVIITTIRHQSFISYLKQLTDTLVYEDTTISLKESVALSPNESMSGSTLRFLVPFPKNLFLSLLQNCITNLLLCSETRLFKLIIVILKWKKKHYPILGAKFFLLFFLIEIFVFQIPLHKLICVTVIHTMYISIWNWTLVPLFNPANHTTRGSDGQWLRLHPSPRDRGLELCLFYS